MGEWTPGDHRCTRPFVRSPAQIVECTHRSLSATRRYESIRLKGPCRDKHTHSRKRHRRSRRRWRSFVPCPNPGGAIVASRCSPSSPAPDQPMNYPRASGSVSNLPKKSRTSFSISYSLSAYAAPTSATRFTSSRDRARSNCESRRPPISRDRSKTCTCRSRRVKTHMDNSEPRLSSGSHLVLVITPIKKRTEHGHFVLERSSALVTLSRCGHHFGRSPLEQQPSPDRADQRCSRRGWRRRIGWIGDPLPPHGLTRMTVFPARRLLELKVATASSSDATVPMLVRSRPSRTR